MGYSSQAGQVILRSQAAQGVYQADTGTAGIGTKLRGGTLAPNRSMMIPDPEIGGGRDVGDAYLSPISWSGDLSYYIRPNMLLPLLKSCLGAPTFPAPVSGVGTATFTPSDAAALPFLSIEERVGAGLEVFRYTDAIVNTLHFECAPDGYAMGTASMIAAKQTAGNTATATPLWDASPMLVGPQVALTYNGVALPVKSFSLDINNNIDDSDWRLGSLYLGDLTPKRREVTAGFTLRETSIATWRQAVYGSPTATAPLGGVASKQALVITLTSYEMIAASTPYSITLTIPNFAINPYALAVNADDIIDDDISGQALRPSTGTPIMTAVVTTGLTALP